MHISRSMRRIKISRICRYLGNGSRKVCVDAVRLLRARAIQGSRKVCREVSRFLVYSAIHNGFPIWRSTGFGPLREQFGDANAKAQDHQLHLRTRDKLKVDSLSIEAAAAAANNRWPCALRQQHRGRAV